MSEFTDIQKVCPLLFDDHGRVLAVQGTPFNSVSDSEFEPLRAQTGCACFNWKCGQPPKVG